MINSLWFNNFLINNLGLVITALVLFVLIMRIVSKSDNYKIHNQIKDLKRGDDYSDRKLMEMADTLSKNIGTIDRELKHCIGLYESLYSATSNKVKDERKVKGQRGNKYFTPAGKIKKRYVKEFAKYLTPKGKIKKNYTNDSAAIKLYEIIHEA